MQRSLFLAVLVLATPLAGCIVDRPQDLTPTSTAPQESPSADAHATVDGATGDAPEEEPEPASAPPPPESAPPPPSPVSPPPPAPPGPVYATERAFGNITGAGASSTSACCLWLATPESNADALSTLVQAGTVAVIVELRWSDTRFDLDLRVTSPDYEEVGTPDSNATEPDPTAPQNATSNATGASPTIHKGMQWTAVDGTPGTGGGYAVVRVDDVDALRHTGEWAIDIGAKGPVVAAAYEVAITRVTVAAPPADWSAYDSE